MKFKQWLNILEAQKFTPQGNVNTSTNLGPTAIYGGQRTMMPLSWGVDNRAFAGIVDGIGNARANIRARKGAEPGSASQYLPLDDLRRSSMQVAYMPLQLPLTHESGQIRNKNKSLLLYARTISPDPLDDELIYNVDGEMRIKNDSRDMKTRPLYFTKRQPANSNDKETAVNFTTCLMQASFMSRLSKYSELLNLENPTIERKQFPFPVRPRGDNPDKDPYKDSENPRFYWVLMCSFVFSPRSKDSSIGNDIDQDIDRLANPGTDDGKQTQTQTQTSAPASQRTSAPAAGGGGPRATTQMVM